MNNMIVDIAKKLGFNVIIGENDDHNEYDFNKYVGDNDFNFCITVYEDASFVEALREYIESYDPDYEAYLWIGEDGHGKNGAPYHIKDIVDNMIECKNEMINFLNEIENGSK